MKNRYLLMAGHFYYPGAGTSDWIKAFETFEEAEQYVTKIQHPLETFKHGPRKGEVKPNQTIYYDYFVDDRKYDWYEIVDFIDWVYN